MFTRKVPKTVLNSKPNLKYVLFENEVASTKHYFFKCNFTIRELKLADICDNINGAKVKFRTLMKNGMAFKLFKNNLKAIPRMLRDQSANLLRIWVHQCECVFAQRLRRGQQMLCLYSRLWEEHALNEFMYKMKDQLTKHGKELVLTAIGVVSYNWEENRIPDSDLYQYMNELEYIHVLQSKTKSCLECQGKKGLPNKDSCNCQVKRKSKNVFENWTLFIEKKDMVVWRRLHSSGHYEYKLYGSYSDISAEDFLSVQIDTDYRLTWDTTAIELKVIEADPDPFSNSDIIYWEMLWPKMFANRDYVFNRRFLIDCENKTMVIVSKGTKHPSCPIEPGKFRIEDYWSYMVIKPYTELNKPGIEFSLTYYDNPGVNIPQAVTSWVAMRALPDFVERLRDATKIYKKYCKEAGIECIWTVQKYVQNCKKLENESKERSLEDDDDDTNEEENNEKKYQVQRVNVDCNKTNDKCKTKRGKLLKKSSNLSDAEIITSPSPVVQAEQDTSYWKYLYPNYYFS